MFGQPKRWQSNYLGGHYAFAKSKSAVLIISNIGIEARSVFMGKLLFTIPWNEIVDLGQDLLHKQEQSALGGIAQGIGMMSAVPVAVLLAILYRAQDRPQIKM